MQLSVNCFVIIKHFVYLQKQVRHTINCQNTMLLHNRANQNKVYIIETRNHQVIVKRLTPPLIEVLYNTHTNEGKLLNYNAVPASREITDSILQAAVKKAVAFAKHNIINDNG